MITKEDLLKAGYKFYDRPQPLNHADGLFQKVFWVTRENAVLPHDKLKELRWKKGYFINFFLYDWEKYPQIKKSNRFTFQVDAQIFTQLACPIDVRDSSKEFTMDVTLILEENHTVEDVEFFFRQAYSLMRCVPDRHNND